MNLRDFFYLQRNDRQALLAILVIMSAAATLVFLLGNRTEAELEAIDSSNQVVVQHASQEQPAYYQEGTELHEAFPFDPNTADSTQLRRLGLNAWQVKGIMRYRDKGGVYSRPSDFARVYGLTKKQYETLLPFIRIGEDYKPASDFYGNEPYQHGRQLSSSSLEKGAQEKATPEKVYSYPHKLQAGQYININTADTTELMKIPGIGSYYAKCIVRYRDKLGGFVSAKQLLEIDGVPESASTYIKIDAQQIHKLNVNKLSVNQLKAHPYLNFYQAKAIVEYVHKRGPLRSLEELKLLKDFPPDEIERLKPYVCF